MNLVDWEVLEEIKKGNIIINPFIKKNLGPNTYDVTLGPIMLTTIRSFIDPKKFTPKYIEKNLPCTLHPKEFILGVTRETIGTLNNISGYIIGRSTFGRLGLKVESAPFVDTGFCGHLTLEIYNHSDNSILLTEGLRFAQIQFIKHSTPLINYQIRKNSKYKVNESKIEKPRGYKIDKEWLE